MSLGPTVTVTPTYATVEIDANGATVTVDVPETTVDITGVGPQGPAGTGADGYLLQAYDSTDQVAASTTVAYPIRLGTVDISDGITVANNGSSQPTRITFANDGNYDVQFSIQFVNTSASEANANVWFRKNDVDLADSNSQITVPKKHGSADGAIIMALNLIVNAAGGDYVEIMWQTESTDVSIQYLPAGTTPTTPATPSVIVTATVNRYLEVGPAGPGVPTGGTTGQYLRKTSSTNYDTAWATLPNDLPTGGTTGQVLSKVSSTNYDTTWSTPTVSGMVFIKKQTISAGVATVEVTGAFSSTYRNYLIVVDRAANDTPNSQALYFTLGSSTSGYYYAGQRVSYGASGTNLGASNTSNWLVGYTERQSWGGQQGVNINVYSPNLANRTAFTAVAYGGDYWTSTGGLHVTETSYTSFKITVASGLFQEGQIAVYGYTL